jgi:hypothetical protein
MSVDSWQPIQAPTQLDELAFKKLIELANQANNGSNLTPEMDWIQPLAHTDNKIWSQSAQNIEERTLINLIRLLTQLEEKQNWNLAEKSPVIALFKALRKKAGIDKELVQWVKAHSQNKYLPFGPLL